MPMPCQGIQRYPIHPLYDEIEECPEDDDDEDRGMLIRNLYLIHQEGEQ